MEIEKSRKVEEELSTPCNGFPEEILAFYDDDMVKALSTPCNGFPNLPTDYQNIEIYFLSTPCNGFVNPLYTEKFKFHQVYFQLHVMDSKT